MNKIKSAVIEISCVEYDENKIIIKLGYSIETLDEQGKKNKISTVSGLKESLIIAIKAFLRDKVSLTLKTSIGNNVEMVGDKYLRTVGNKSTTDDLGDLKKCL